MRAALFLKLLIGILVVSAQGATIDFPTAVKQYESSQNEACIQSLKSIERASGPSPRVQSLLVYCYQANNDPVNAKIELIKYKRLAVDRSSEAHRDLMALEPSLDAAIQRLEESHEETILDERMREADAIVAAADNTPERKQSLEIQKQAEEALKPMLREEEAFEQVALSSAEEGERLARIFNLSYPSSFHRDSVEALNQKFLVEIAAKNNYPERALTQLEDFKARYPQSPYMNMARSVYHEQWRSAREVFERNYKIHKSSANQEILDYAGVVLVTTAAAVAGVGVVALLAPEYGIKPVLIAGGATMAFGLVVGLPIRLPRILAANSRADYNLEKVRRYSRPPVY